MTPSMSIPIAIFMLLSWIIGAVGLSIFPLWAPVFWAFPAGWLAGDAITILVEKYATK